MNKTAEIIEIFESIQGEGLLVGVKQLFIRFCGCNLRCNYCDTAFSNGKRYTVDELMNELEKYDLEKIHSISLTGGEPLLHSEFLQGFMYKAKNKHPKLKFYLETNATLYKKINEIIEYTDIIAADIKLNSSTNQTNQFEAHEEFFKAVRNYRVDCALSKQYDCKNKEMYAKIVFNETITNEEIEKSIELAEKYELEIILQPQMKKETLATSPEGIIKTLDKFLTKYKKVRVIPQTHKMIKVE